MTDTTQRTPSYVYMLIVVTAIHVVTLFARNAIVGDSKYNFLLWNLFLGLVPLLVAWALQARYAAMPRLLFFAGAVVWLLFYPNAPYMITDVIHVSPSDPIVLYDGLIIFSFATLSLFFGLYSLVIIRHLFTLEFDSKIAHAVIILSLLASSFGIYLGRILRLNSWDLFTEPLKTMVTIFHHLFPVSQNPTTYLITVIFTAIQFYLLLMIRDLETLETPGKE